MRRLLLIILAFNLVAGLVNITQYEFKYSDEGHFIAESSLLLGDSYLTGMSMFVANKPLFIGLNAVFLRVFGFTIMPMLLLNVALGAAVVYMVYVIGRLLFDEKVGIASAVLLSSSRIHLAFVKSYMAEPMLAFFSLLGVYLFIRALKEKRARLFILAGASASLAFNTKVLGVVSLAMMVLFMIITFFLEKRPHVTRDIALILLGFVAVYSVIVVIYLAFGYSLLDHHLYIFISLVDHYSIGHWLITSIPFLDSLPRMSAFPGSMFDIREQMMYVFYFFAGFSIIVPVLFFIGAYQVARKRGFGPRFLAIWLLVTVFELFMIGYGAPRALYIIIPLVCIVGATVVHDVEKRFKRWFPGYVRLFYALALVVMFASLLPVITYVARYSGALEGISQRTLSTNPKVVSYFTHNDSIAPLDYDEMKALEAEGYDKFIYFSWFDYVVKDTRIKDSLRKPVSYVEYEIEDWRVPDELYAALVFLRDRLGLESLNFFISKISTTSPTQYVAVYDLRGGYDGDDMLAPTG